MGIILAFAIQRPALASDPSSSQILNASVIGSNFVAGSKLNSSNWVDVEESTNLADWSSAGTILSTNSTAVFSTIFDNQGGQRHYFRLKSPGETAEQARTNWDSRQIENYSFRMQSISLDAQLEAVGTVTNGAKTITKVTNLITGEAVTQFNPDDFPDVQEQFELLARAENDGIWSAIVSYDSELSFPREIMLRRVSGFNDEIKHYKIIEFIPAPPANRK